MMATPYKPLSAEQLYTEAVPDSDLESNKTPGYGVPRRAIGIDTSGALEIIPKNVLNLSDHLALGCEIAGAEAPLLGSRVRSSDGAKMDTYTWVSYSEVINRAKCIGNGLRGLGVLPKSNVGIYSINRLEWTLIEQACYSQNIVTVPLYDTLGIDAMIHIINQTEMQVLACTSDLLATIFKARASIPTLLHIILMDVSGEKAVSSAVAAASSQRSPNTTDSGTGVPSGDDSHSTEPSQISDFIVTSLTKLEEDGSASSAAKNTADAGNEVIADSHRAVRDDIATICYTSGTTGMPKGALLSHGNILHCAYCLLHLMKSGRFTLLSKGDRHISYLPLAHVFERVTHQLMISFGGCIGFFSGSAADVPADAAILKPTLFVGVPRVFNKLYDKVRETVNTKGGVAKWLFNKAVTSKTSRLLMEGIGTHAVWDALVLRKVRDRLGGCVRLIFSGSSPLHPDVLLFLRVAFGCDVYEGYGQTETAAGLSTNDRLDIACGHVGVPIPGVQVRLADIPEMGYSSNDTPYPRGEIQVKGPNVFKGYFKNPEKTAETLLPGGWLSTGDVGQWGAGGRLVIIDRIKNMFKLAQGEFISPENIESVYIRHPLVQSVFIYGDSLRSQVVGILCPDPLLLQQWAQSKQLNLKWPPSPQDNTNSPGDLATLERALLVELNTFARSCGLKGYELIAAAHITDQDFTVVESNKTPTWKVRREVVKKSYSNVIDELYTRVQNK